MTIDYPKSHQIPALRQLWQEAFGDSDAFLDIFFTTGYSPLRCRCITDGDAVAAALYWFDCTCRGKKIAYLYAVATAVSRRGQGLCRRLMADTHQLLATQSYSGAILVPGEETLFRFYAAQGYETVAFADTLRQSSAIPALPLTRLTCEAYALRRQQLLPDGAVIQEGENLAFLSQLCDFYGGESWVMAANLNGTTLTAMEFLGDHHSTAGILTALQATEGTFRTPGSTPFAMYLGFDGSAHPTWFGLPFD